MRFNRWFLLSMFALAGCSSASPPEPATPPIAHARRAPSRAEPSIPARLTGDLVRPVLARMDGAVSGCYAIEYGGQEADGGRLVVDWMIAPSGKVESVSIAESSFGNPSFESCVLQEALGLEFPTARNPTQIRKPYLVRRDDTDDADTARF